MASQPGILTDWPWKPLGNFKYLVLAPFIAHNIYSVAFNGYVQDPTYYFGLLIVLARMLHNQIWISVSRYRTAKGNNRIVDKGLEFDQVDRESNWDDHILLNGLLSYLLYTTFPQASRIPLWRTDGVVITALLQIGPVEFLYYWLHRALHHHFLYSRYHSYHHSSIVTQPITAVIHPFAEILAYFVVFSIPLMTTILFTKTISIASFAGYLFYVDFMNNLGHCNLEFFPKKLFSIFPLLKYLCYTPSFHSLHHTKFRTNYSLFTPLYDYIYGTVDESTDDTYETSLNRPRDSPDVVHLTHLTTSDSIYHLPLGFASLASNPQTPKWYLCLMWPFTFVSKLMSWIFGHTFVSESNTFEKLNLQSWVVPRFTKQKEDLNDYGQLYIHKFPKLKVKIVDGSSLAAAIVVNSISNGTKQVLLRGNFDKVSFAIANSLCEANVQVSTLYENELTKLHLGLNTKPKESFALSTASYEKIWLVGDGWDEDEQMNAPKGTLFIPFSQFPPKKMRKDCFYHYTPAMLAPSSITYMHCCENWLPRRVMSAWRVAGTVHALEGWNVHECGSCTFSLLQIWDATIRHGFQPLVAPIPSENW